MSWSATKLDESKLDRNFPSEKDKRIGKKIPNLSTPILIVVISQKFTSASNHLKYQYFRKGRLLASVL